MVAKQQSETTPATMEVDYLAPVLRAFPPELRYAVDVGAHRGDVTEALANLGFGVLAVEPQPWMADRLADRLAAQIEAGTVQLSRCAASDRSGSAELLIGSASTVSSLEPAWTTRAFPEEFANPRRLTVRTECLCELLQRHHMPRIGFAKIDVEGHEAMALRGLLSEGEPPAIVMFEANQRFGAAALRCLQQLHKRGYDAFDIFIRVGADPIAAERFSEPKLPAAWRACGNRYFYANIIAYHSASNTDFKAINPRAFLAEYQQCVGREVLRRSLAHESAHPVAVHPIWSQARQALQEHLLRHDWSDLLRHPVCKHMFVRGQWKAPQDFERAALQKSAFGRRLLATVTDPDIGNPPLSDRQPGLSTNMLGMLYYLDRLRAQSHGRLPDRVIELGGGYGAFAWLYARQAPSCAYVILDLPEMLAIQHYFLTQALPSHAVIFAAEQPVAAAPGTITLVPVSRIGQTPLQCELLFSTFAFSEMPRELQQCIENDGPGGYFGARQLFVAGQLASEFPGVNLVAHPHVVGAAMQRFNDLDVRRFHIGDNYLLAARRPAEAVSAAEALAPAA